MALLKETYLQQKVNQLKLIQGADFNSKSKCQNLRQVLNRAKQILKCGILKEFSGLNLQPQILPKMTAHIL